jgi:hypothetical protein
MEARIQALNIEIKKLKEQTKKVDTLLAHENFAYNIIESQFEQLKVRNQQLQTENMAMEAKIKDSLTASEKILENARKEAEEIKTHALVLSHKARAKYSEIEESLSKAEKKQIEQHLKELETVAA